MKRMVMMGSVLVMAMGLMAQMAPQRQGVPQVAPRPQGGERVQTPAGRPGGVQQGRGMDRRTPGRMERQSRLSEADQKLLDTIEESESLRELIRLSRRAAASRHTEIRMAMVDALEGRGVDAAEELAVYIADPDEDVADAAFTAWSSLVSDMKPTRRVRAILAAATSLQESRRTAQPEPPAPRGEWGR